MADPWVQSRPVRVRELLALDVMEGGTLVGGVSGLDHRVLGVSVSSNFVISDPEPGVLVVIDGASLNNDTYQVDLALRTLGEAGGAAIVVISPRVTFGLATARLANKLGLPVVVLNGADPLRLGDQLRSVTLAPQLLTSTIIIKSLSALRSAPETGGASALLDSIAALLQASVTLVGSEGAVVAGAALDPPLPERSRLPVALKERNDDLGQVTQPISLAPRERPSFWLVARRPDATESWLSTAENMLQIAAWCLGTRLVTDRLQRERDARFRLGVLNAITAASEHPEPALVEQIGVLGWSVTDWNTAVHIHVAGDADQQRILALTDDMQRALAQSGIRIVPIERPDGWTLWTTAAAEPQPRTYADTVKVMRRITRHFVDSYSGLRLYVGIGRPFHGLGGLQKSLSEAREASIIAQAAGGDAVVQHIDELGVKRILLGWYASDSFAEFARTLLGPLIAADTNGELLITLEAFLDSESSPTETALRLGVHRNTIINRMERARALLTVDLDDGDERLAVQLACRVARLKAFAS